MFLSTVIPNSNSPSWNIDVCLQPLIDELKLLWSSELWLMMHQGKKNLDEGNFDIDYQ
jgi:hypothetical protein